MCPLVLCSVFFFFNDTATTEIYTLSLHDALPISNARSVVKVGLEISDESLVMSVADEGVGIAPEFLPHVFERFSQASAPATRGHSGLGLEIGRASCRERV